MSRLLTWRRHPTYAIISKLFMREKQCLTTVAMQYLHLKEVTFHSFPHATREKKQRQLWIRALRREPDWVPNKFSRVCSKHFVNEESLTTEHPIPTLFDCNQYKRPTKERSSKVAELRDAMRKTMEIDLPKANVHVDTARDDRNDFISDEAYIQYYYFSLDSSIAEQIEITTDVYSGV